MIKQIVHLNGDYMRRRLSKVSDYPLNHWGFLLFFHSHSICPFQKNENENSIYKLHYGGEMNELQRKWQYFRVNCCIVYPVNHRWRFFLFLLRITAPIMHLLRLKGESFSCMATPK